MPTSGETSFNPVRDQIVKGALRLVGAYNSGSTPSPDQMADATEALNILLKSWQVEGFLWLRKFAVLTLTPGQSTYKLGPQEDGTPSTDVCVYDGTATQINRPTRILAASYRNSSNYDMPMIPISRDEYMALTNKGAAGRSVEYYYDPQLIQGQLKLWPVPEEADHIYLTVDRPIQDIVSDTDTFDMPQEWLRLAKYGTAVEIAPEYALPSSEYDRLLQRYAQLHDAIDSYDQEPAISYMQRGFN